MILGCGRSGTSIFGELFEHIPFYRYSSEPAFDRVFSADFGVPQAFKVPRESAGFEVPEPGLSFPMGLLRTRVPGMKYFWIVRHPLDAIASLRVGISKNWGHHPRPPDWRDWLRRPLLERCAYHWAFLNMQGYNQVASFAALRTFEDMIRNPLEFAQGICREIELDPHSVAEALASWACRVQDTSNDAFIEAKTSRSYSRPDHSRRIGRWRENLSQADVMQVWPIVAKTAERFGYTR